MTTASITVIDKNTTSRKWKYYDIDDQGNVIKRRGVTGSRYKALDYEKRGSIWALRGLSPGSQKIFTLSESERIRLGLNLSDVVPCVTSLKSVPKTLRVLSKPAFRKHYVKTGRKCWLIKSHQKKISSRLQTYLDSIPPEKHDNYTCNNREPWFRYSEHPVPQLLFSSGFTEYGPKVLINSIGACAVGSVTGVHADQVFSVRSLQTYLTSIDFEKRVVGHAAKLKKVEIKQLNSVLNVFTIDHD